MYLDHINIQNFRSFRRSKMSFAYPGQDFKKLGISPPKIKNLNLILGDNGYGKTSLLRAIALACLGPVVSKSGLYPYRLIRREPAGKEDGGNKTVSGMETFAEIEADFAVSSESTSTQEHLGSNVQVHAKKDLEVLEWRGAGNALWDEIYSESSHALFVVGYGAGRRVDLKEAKDMGRRRVFARVQRIQSLFEDSYALMPLSGWLPQLRRRNRFAEVVELINRLMGRGHYTFTGVMRGGEYLFERGGLEVPYPALSDGYRAFLGWIGDLLYHIYKTIPNNRPLAEARGVVMVDEIDLHLHPKWQMTILPTLAAALPNVQFIVTSHSPLLVGSVELGNIISMKEDRKNQASRLVRLNEPVHGLDADQVLLTDYFGLKSSRAAGRDHVLKKLTIKARSGDEEAAMELLNTLAHGTEKV